MKKIVVALGGNALGKTPEEQLKLVKSTAKSLVDLVEEGYNLVVTHGNGPQVGMINLSFDYSHNNGGETPLMPFAECGAMSQGYIGYHLQQAIQIELKVRNINKDCATIITQVRVNKKDPAFENPDKPVGMFYSESEAKKIESEKGYTFVNDAGRGYRRVVPSPKPIEIMELDLIKDLLDQGNIVIVGGGGGIPVIEDENELKGVDAVIDKDRTSALIAKEINAERLIILTAVPKVVTGFNTINQKDIDEMDLSEANKYIRDGEFARGSMLPKVEAMVDYISYKKDGVGIITSLDCAKEALLNKTGTIIKNSQKGGKKMAKKGKKREFMSAFTIIFVLIILLAAVTLVLPSAKFDGETIVDGSGVVAATLPDVLLSPFLGFEDAVDVCIFTLVLGGFLAIVLKTGAFETGIKVLVKKLKGNELVLIPILMIIFSIGGTTYGMLEETVGFYALLAFTMVAAGMDTIVAASTILLGAGSGVLGSTINPFATGAAVAALPDGIVANQGILIALGTVLWLTSLGISMYFVMKYAKKVKADKGSTFLSLQEQKKMETFSKDNSYAEEAKLTSRQIATLWIFGFAFLTMIIGFIPWESFGITIFASWTAWLTGYPLGQWWFYDAALWFFLIGIIIGIINKFRTNEIIDEFIGGARDILSVVLIIAVARGASVLMSATYLDNYIIFNAAEALKNTSVALFVPGNYLLHVLLSVLVPSSSGLASLSTPIMGPLTAQLGFSVETTVMTFVAANGLVNLFTPTCGAIMGGLTLAKVNYTTWLKWSLKIIVLIAVASMAILTLAGVLLS